MLLGFFTRPRIFLRRRKYELMEAQVEAALGVRIGDALIIRLTLAIVELT